MLKMKGIEAAEIEWAAPIVLAPKKIGSIRFYVGYLEQNAINVRDLYPIQQMDEFVTPLGDALTSSTLDANRGYLQVEIEDADRDKTSFPSHHGLY